MNRILDRQLLKQEFSGCDSPPEFETYLAVASAYSVTENAVAVLSDLKERTYILWRIWRDARNCRKGNCAQSEDHLGRGDSVPDFFRGLGAQAA